MTHDPKAFQPLTIDNDVDFTVDDGPHRIRVRAFRSEDLSLGGDGTHYVMLTDGAANLHHKASTILLRKGMFAVVPGHGALEVGTNGRGLVITKLAYYGLFQVGGPLEERGRLLYIDGCSDTLLASPDIKGNPCLNHLHMPIGTSQTQHTHPSERIGVILRGHGECRTPNATIKLEPGMGWRIPTGCEHSFFTFDDSLDVVAWHPDSDFGPTHDDHPMVNRTYVEGVASSQIEAIRTKVIAG